MTTVIRQVEIPSGHAAGVERADRVATSIWKQQDHQSKSLFCWTSTHEAARSCGHVESVSAWEEQNPALSSQSLFLADDLQTNPLAGTLEQSDTHTGRGEPSQLQAWWLTLDFFQRGRRESEKKRRKKRTLLIKEPWSWHIGNKYRQCSTLICPWKCMQTGGVGGVGTSDCEEKFNLRFYLSASRMVLPAARRRTQNLCSDGAMKQTECITRSRTRSLNSSGVSCVNGWIWCRFGKEMLEFLSEWAPPFPVELKDFEL